MRETPITNNELELRRNNSVEIMFTGIWAICTIIFIIEGSDRRALFFKEGFTIIQIVVLSAFFIIAPLICISRIVFNPVQVRITGAGIWTRKCRLFLWTDIWYINTFQERRGRGYAYFLNVRLKDEAVAGECTEVKIHLSNMNKSESVMKLVLRYMETYNILNLENTITPVKKRNELF